MTRSPHKALASLQSGFSQCNATNSQLARKGMDHGSLF
jgi:hypothetical protein